MNTSELIRSKAHFIVELIEYIPNAIVKRTILKRPMGNIVDSTFDEREAFVERVLPFDNYIQIRDGVANIKINEKNYKLDSGEGMVIPAHTRHCFIANEQFKMISTFSKSNY